MTTTTKKSKKPIVKEVTQPTEEMVLTCALAMMRRNVAPDVITSYLTAMEPALAS